MMENYEYLYTTSTAIYIFSSLLVITASIILYTKTPTKATILVLIGSVLAFLIDIGNMFMEALGGPFDFKIYAITNLLSGLAYAMFCIGLLLFVIYDLKTGESKNEFLD